MLTKFAPETNAVTETKVNAKEIALSQRQEEMVNKIQKSGGFFQGDDLAAFGDQRTVNALVRKGVLEQTGARAYTLSEVFVQKEEDKNKKVHATGSEFAEALTDIFGYGGQSRLAELLGVNKATVGKWVQGKLDVPQYAVVFMATLQHCKEIGAPLPDFMGIK